MRRSHSTSAAAALVALGCLASAACSSGGEDAGSTPGVTGAEDSAAETGSDGSSAGGSTTVTAPTSISDTSWVPPVSGGESQTPALGSSDAPAMMLIQFAQAWEDGNWKSMASVAEEPVVSTATEWFERGAEVSAEDTTAEDLAQGCESGADDRTWACELRYGVADATPTVFTLTISATPDGVRLTELVPVD